MAPYPLNRLQNTYGSTYSISGSMYGLMSTKVQQIVLPEVTLSMCTSFAVRGYELEGGFFLRLIFLF